MLSIKQHKFTEESGGMVSTASPKAGPSVPITIDPRTSFASTSKLVHVLAAAIPVIWIVAALLHPQDQTTANNGTWLAVHIAQLALAPLLGIVMWLLLRPLQGTAAAVGRFAIVLWIALFSAFDAIAGIATGVLVDGGFQEASTYLFEHQTFGGEFSVLGSVAHPMWIVVAISCAVALRFNRARSSAWVAMLASVLFALHAGPFAAVGLAAVALTVWSAMTEEGRPDRERQLA
jgi:hypothetical protein